MNKRLLLAALILCAAVLAGALAFAACYRAAVVPECCRNPASARELDWLRHEYHLSDAQFERIAQVHADYAPRCAEMCRRVCGQRARLAELTLHARATTPEVVEALKAAAALEVECRQATLFHIYAVAAVMSPEEGSRYVAAMLPSVLAPSAPGKMSDCTQTCDMAHMR